MQVSDRSELRQQLLEVFPPAPLPAEFRTGTEDDWPGEGSAETFAAGYSGKTWDALTPEFLLAHRDALLFLDAPAFVEFLPAYLLYLIERETFNEMPFAVGVSLTRKDDERRETFDARFENLSDAQRLAIKRVVESLILVEPMEDVMATAFASYWCDVDAQGRLAESTPGTEEGAK